MDVSNLITFDLLGYLAAGIVFLTFCMRTMTALRIVGIASNLAFIGYALTADLMPILLLHGLLLPLNLFRLYQIRQQVRTIERAGSEVGGADNFDWLIPIAETRRLKPGDTLFRKGEHASSLYVITEGEILLPEIGVVLGPKTMLGEIGLFSRQRTRTTSARAVGDVTLAELTEKKVYEIYFDNPQFAYQLIRLITQRLIDNLQRVQSKAG